MILHISLFFALALSIYLALSYRAWQLKQGIVSAAVAPEKPARELVREASQKTELLLKTSLRFLAFFATEVWRLASGEVKSWIFKAFPHLKVILEEKDKLTGLYHGPASFYLANVSEYKEELGRNLKRRRSF